MWAAAPEEEFVCGPIAAVPEGLGCKGVAPPIRGCNTPPEPGDALFDLDTLARLRGCAELTDGYDAQHNSTWSEIRLRHTLHIRRHERLGARKHGLEVIRVLVK